MLQTHPHNGNVTVNDSELNLSCCQMLLFKDSLLVVIVANIHNFVGLLLFWVEGGFVCVWFSSYAHSLRWMVDLPWKQENCESAQKEDTASIKLAGFCPRLLVGKTYSF